MDKQEVRRYIRALKSDYSLAEKRGRSKSVWENVEQSEPFKNAKVVLAYWSMDDEVFSHDFVSKWAEQKVVLLPCVCDENLEVRRFEGKDRLSLGVRYSILEPTGDLVQDLDSIDLILVPGIAFDTAGNRLGRGKGYYDKILNQTRAYKIGVCFDFQLLDKVPIESHDVKMDQVIYSI